MLIELAESFNHISVELNKVSGTRLLWRDTSATGNNEMSDDQFIDGYSWVTKDYFHRAQCKDSPGITQIMFAERYGGFGIGTNGGGARVVNVGDVQIKGVGANALAGEGALRSHSYGGLDIQGAVKELIYSRLLSKISPVGVQNISGLILLDKTSALHNDQPAPSVLLVREPVARPSHFLPCLNFRIKPEYRAFMRSDFSRVLGIYKGISQQALLAEFYTLIQHFLDRCADQLSFCRMARLSHSALTPSNISMDGRLLDTALCSFVVSGSNYGQLTSYLEEASIPAMVAKEWFYLINKFLTDKPAEEYFLKLYEDRFYQYASVNMGFIFGIDREMSTKLSCTLEWKKVASRLCSLLSIGSLIKTSAPPSAMAVDFVNDILTASLYGILHNSKTHKITAPLAEFIRDLHALMAIVESSMSWHDQNEQGFYKTFAMQTIKRAVLSSYFFISHIGGSVDDYCAAGQLDKTEGIINENDQVAQWLYENLLSEHCTIFSANGVVIVYSRLVDGYIYRGRDGSETCVNDVRTLRAIIDMNKSDFIVQNYNFYPFLRRLFAFVGQDAKNSFNGVKNVFC